MTDRDLTPKKENGDLIKRTGVEAEIERSMRLWHDMRAERDEAHEQISKLSRDLVEATAEKSVYINRNSELEKRNEELLIELTKLKSLLTNIGAFGDSISAMVAEVMAMSSAPPPPPLSPQTPTPEITPREGESIQDLARRLAPELNDLDKVLSGKKT